MITFHNVRILQKLKKIMPFTVGIILVIFSIILFQFVDKTIKTQSESRLQADFDVESQKVINVTENFIKEYSDVLIGARALFNASSSVERNEWRDFYKSLDIEKNFPALKAIEVVPRVKESEIAEFESLVKSDTSVDKKGYPDFSVKSDGDLEDHYIVKYVEPLNNNLDVFGFDLYSSNERRKAIDLARDTNSIVLTGPIKFIQDGEKAFLIVLPIYEKDSDTSILESRRDNIEGVIIAAVSDKEFFSQVVLSSNLNKIDGFSVTDITDDELKILDDDSENSVVQNSQIVIGTRIWKFDFKSNTILAFSSLEKSLPYIFLISGLAVSLLIFILLSNAIRLQERAESLAEDLTEDLAKFKLAVEGASEHIVISDSNGKILYANPAASKITGYSQSEIIGNTPALWGGNMSKEFYQNMWDVIKNKRQVFVSEVKNRNKSGTVYDAEIHIAPVFDQKKNALYFIAIERDITQEKQLKEIKDRQSQSLLDSISEGIIITDSEDSVTYTNQKLTEITGKQQIDILNKKIDEIFDIEKDNGQKVRLSKDNISGRFFIKQSEDKKIAVRVSSSPVMVESSNKGSVYVIHDSSEEYSLQRERDEFFSIASHELRTPLTVISGNLDILLSMKKATKENKDERSMIKDTIEASDNLIKIVNDFLNVSSLEQGEVHLKSEDVDPCKLIFEIESVFIKEATKKKIKIINKCVKNKFTVKTDSQVLKRIIENIISNAIKFTENGEIRFETQIDKNNLLIYFKDTGIGISEENQKYVFKKFQQAMQSHLAREKGGTGVGLYLSREYARLMGGDVYLEDSRLGEGSTFVIKLPLAKSK